MSKAHAAGPTPVEVTGDTSATTVLWQRAESSPDKVILRYPADAEGRRWGSVTYRQLADRIERVGAGLVSLGVEPGDRVALMSATRVEWTISDLAILAAGAVTVPIYDTSSVEQCAWILSDAGVKVAIAETADHAKNLDAARERAPDLAEVFVLDDAGLDALAERGGDAERDTVRARARAVRADDLASIIYTSGTTGNPKGCMLTHRNFVWTARQSEMVLRDLLGDEDSTLLFLPLAHVFARLVQYLFLEADVEIGYARSINTVAEDLQSFSPTFLLSVPRVFEKVFNGAQRKAEGPKRKVFDFAVSTAAEWSTAVDAGQSPGRVTTLKHKLADKLVYAKLRHALGGRIAWCISGGAPLSARLAHFFRAAGITILEGYGLTETTAPATVNTPQRLRIGTVGPPLPGVEVRTADDGEILIKGGNVFSGYFHNEAATAEAFDSEGWLRTGDLGELDGDGFLRITGRKKEIIVTSGGKNVSPATLEARLKSHPLVSQCVVVGDQRPFIAALVTLEPEELAAFSAEHNLTGSPAQLSAAPQVVAEVEKAVAHANAAVSQAEAIRAFKILERDFSMEEGEVTPKMEARRTVVAEHFAAEIDALYTR